MGKKVKWLLDKEAIIAEYLLGDTTYRKLSEKYGVGVWRAMILLSYRRKQRKTSTNGRRTVAGYCASLI